MKTLLSFILIAFSFASCTSKDKKADSTSGVQAPSIDIHTAVMTDNLEAVQQHIKAGTDLDQKEPMSGSTALITAATFDKQDIAKALIDAGADLSVQNSDGSTALHSAAFFCRVEIVQMLIDAQADKDIRNNYGATARESVMGPMEPVKPVYEMMQQQLGGFGLQLDMAEIEKTRPVIAMMLQ
ncbi:MAG TPA: ankyrin repeat domain-containing protein [Balneolaceae bacterium]|nr:ankyrin repeat domain-containing protein [Balneolaceae bacterium]|tara:strand:+ start:17139 stop:17687 length:549 start_codon:yes stop_codon:yes gene_type:complete